MNRFEIPIYKRKAPGAGIKNAGTLRGEFDGVGSVRVVWLVDSVHACLLVL
jgi:hypothetical protein